MKESAKQHFSGLSSQEALQRLNKFGRNELKSEDTRRLWQIILGALKEPMVLLLIGIGGIYSILGETEEVFSLLIFLLLILAITIYQENKTEKTLKALKELSSPRAVVVRDGVQLRIPGAEVVPGDLILLNEGDRIPADIELLEGGPLSVDESVITGESFAVNKSSAVLEAREVLSGTLILKGQALGKVLRTGRSTELGKIGQSIEGGRLESTPLQRATRKVVNKLSLLVSALALFVIVYYWLAYADLFTGFLTSLTLAMAILPNELPAVLLIFLAAGAWRISKRNVLTRKIPSIEALGGITHLCVDKTGTITQNRMILKKLWNGESYLDLTGQLYNLPEPFHEILEFGILASPRDPFDPMERTLRNAGAELLNHTEHLHPDWRLLREYQISDELLAVSYAWGPESSSGYHIGAKGAPEAIIDICHLENSEAQRIEREMTSMAAEGLRVIAVARSFSTALPEKQHDLNFDFLGLIGFEDPIRSDAAEAVLECQRAGIKVLMMTGDHPATAKRIAQLINLDNPTTALTGRELKKMNDEDLSGQLQTVQIFCRMKPLDKFRVVNNLKQSGAVVAMTGDGVNDAPALREAQIGIAMGKRGTDVAREAAEVVLIDDSFSSIVAAVRIGRRIFRNLREAFSYLLAIHVPITVMSLVPVIFNLPLILLPLHIAFLHLIIEPASTTLFEALPEDESMMRQKPRKNVEVMSKRELIASLVEGSFLSIAVLSTYFYSIYRGLNELDVRGITFTTLILSNLALIYVRRRGTTELNITGKTFWTLTLATFSLLGCVLYLPFFRELFRFSYLHLHDLLPCLAVSFCAGACIYIYRRMQKIPCA